jgi:SAM-dependent methyltransferase
MSVCPVCEQTVDRWLPHPHIAQRSPFMALMQAVGSDLSVYQCPRCACTDRDRHVWLYMNAAGLPAQLAGASVLHIAPERHLEPLIEACRPARYVRGDLFPSRPNQVRVDIEALQFDDASFDLIVCNHVLEHVADPAQALAELQRCLKPGGLLIAQTPYSPLLKSSFELNFSPAPAEFAKIYFGQADHVRLFGADIASHFHAAGFEGDLLPHDSVLSGIDALEFGCNAREPFFAFSKPGLPATAQLAG